MGKNCRGKRRKTVRDSASSSHKNKLAASQQWKNVSQLFTRTKERRPLSWQHWVSWTSVTDWISYKLQNREVLNVTNTAVPINASCKVLNKRLFRELDRWHTHTYTLHQTDLPGNSPLNEEGETRTTSWCARVLHQVLKTHACIIFTVNHHILKKRQKVVNELQLYEVSHHFTVNQSPLQ